jgi:histidinol-phosphatase
VSAEGLRDLLEFAVEVAWRAGRITLAHYQTGIAAETKPDDSPVTMADRDAERIVRDLIRTRFPADGIVGEEMASEREGADRRWIIDPIDGTRSFVRGVPLYGVLIALEEEGDPVLGVAHFPALNETVYAARSLGCWWNGRRALVSETTKLADALVVTSDAEHPARAGRSESWQRLRAGFGLCRTWGDCYGYVLVATGRADVMLDPVMNVWDCAALLPVLEEAGGTFTDWQGRRTIHSGNALATNGALFCEVMQIIKENGRDS